MAHIRWRVDCVSYHSQAHCSWVAVMVAFCRLFFISFFSLISYAGPDSQTTLYTEFESIDWLLIANWIRKECACLGWEAGALKLHWLHTNESDGWRLFSGSILNVHLYLRECQVVHIIHSRSWKAWYREYEGLKLQVALNSFLFFHVGNSTSRCVFLKLFLSNRPLSKAFIAWHVFCKALQGPVYR